MLVFFLNPDEVLSATMYTVRYAFSYVSKIIFDEMNTNDELLNKHELVSQCLSAVTGA